MWVAGATESVPADFPSVTFRRQPATQAWVSVKTAASRSGRIVWNCRRSVKMILSVSNRSILTIALQDAFLKKVQEIDRKTSC